jgi:hypothetical protein
LLRPASQRRCDGHISPELEKAVFWKKKLSPEQKAELLGERLRGEVPAIASALLSRLDEDYGIKRGDVDVRQFVIELFVFYMHILDRMALGILGVDGQNLFVDRLIVVLVCGILSDPGESKNDSVDFIAQLHDTFNRRQVQYSKYKLRPDEGEPFEGFNGTLFWEFGRILFALTAAEDTRARVALVFMVEQATVVMLGKGFVQAEEILRG